MSKGLRRIIRSEQGTNLPHATFRQFERRPVNYFKDILTDEDHIAEPQASEDEIRARVDEAITEERERQRQAYDQELQKQFQAGLAKGRTEAAADLKRGIELLEQYARVLQAEKQEMADKAEQSSVELAFSIAAKILDSELQIQPEKVRDVVKSAMRQVLDCDQIRLRVNVDDFRYLKEVQADLQSLVSSDVPLEIRADDSVARGGCMIETEKGALDARIATQLETLRVSLTADSTVSRA
ncbi:MAG: FliH/SctL family protein [Calditrichota bacterium]